MPFKTKEALQRYKQKSVLPCLLAIGALSFIHPEVSTIAEKYVSRSSSRPAMHCKFTGGYSGQFSWCIGFQNFKKYIFRREINVFFVNKLISTEKLPQRRKV
jgi:hypothetical protein